MAKSLSTDGMKFAVLMIPALAMAALAQEPVVNPPVQLKSIVAAVAAGEVRIEIETTAPVESPGSVVARQDSLTVELPGVAAEQGGKRIAVNQGGVRDVLASPQQNPLLTRITVRTSRSQPYLLSTEGNRIILRIGAALQTSATPAQTQPNHQQTGAAPSARRSTGAKGAIAGIFRRAPKQQVYDSPDETQKSAEALPAAPLPPIRIPQPKPQEQAADTAAAPERSASVKPAPVAQLGALPEVGATPRESIAPAAANSLPVTSAAAEPAIGGSVAGVAELRATPPVPNADLRTLFHVKFVQQDVAYIDGGRSAGLAEGMKLLVTDADPSGALVKNTSPDATVAELVVVGIAETSAVTEIHAARRNVLPGDSAYLSNADMQALVQQHSLSSTRKYPAVLSFTDDNDALDEEARVQDVPRPPLPSVNRMQGRIGFDYFGTRSFDASQAGGRDVGIVLRADFTRIGGTYWNFRGYWRGRIDSTSAAAQPTLQELINRTYHLGLTYDNPTGPWLAGFGRLYLPWASSLDTIDGGYFGFRLRPGVIAGIFAGSTPDPTSWNYNPQRQLGGSFVNFTGGSFDGFHYSSTSGAGISLLAWQTDRPFIFFENSLSYKRSFSIYDALQADSPAGNAAVSAPGAGIGRSFFTTRWSPVPHLQLDFNHTYFRDIPTFDPSLIGTGLLDKYLFQGFSGGARVEIVKQVSVYTELGRSTRTGDSTMALNDMYGITFGRVPWLDLRADAHYSRFNSSFGSGSYRAASLSRNFNERFRLEILGGDQAFISTLAGNQTARFVTATIDSNVNAYLFTQGAFTVYRGQQQNYDQWMFTLGYRFDSRWMHK